MVLLGTQTCEDKPFWLLPSYVNVLLNGLREHARVIDERIALPKERAPDQYVSWGQNGHLKWWTRELDLRCPVSVC
jgi:hypothetical protein